MALPSQIKPPGWMAEFQAFIMRGNVVDLAVGIIIGAAFTAIVGSRRYRINFAGQQNHAGQPEGRRRREKVALGEVGKARESRELSIARKVVGECSIRVPARPASQGKLCRGDPERDAPDADAIEAQRITVDHEPKPDPDDRHRRHDCRDRGETATPAPRKAPHHRDGGGS